MCRQSILFKTEGYVYIQKLSELSSSSALDLTKCYAFNKKLLSRNLNVSNISVIHLINPVYTHYPFTVIQYFELTSQV